MMTADAVLLMVAVSLVQTLVIGVFWFRWLAINRNRFNVLNERDRLALLEDRRREAKTQEWIVVMGGGDEAAAFKALGRYDAEQAKQRFEDDAAYRELQAKGGK